jgi:hypothetical protein
MCVITKGLTLHQPFRARPQAVVQPRRVHEPNSLGEFVPPPKVYDGAVANARDEHEEEYLGPQ